MKRLFKSNIKSNLLIITLMIISTTAIAKATLLFVEVINAIQDKNIKNTVIYLLIQMGLWLLGLITKTIYSKMINKNICETEKKLANNLTNKICNYNINEFKQQNISEYISKYTNDINQLELRYLKNFYQILSSSISLIITLIALASLNYLFVIFVLTLFLVLYFTPKLFDKVYNKKNLALSSAGEVYTNKLRNELAGYEIYDDYNQKDNFLNKMKLNYSSYLKEKLNFYSFEINFELFNNILNVFAQFIGVLFVGVLICLNIVPIGVLISFGNLQGTFFNSCLQLVQTANQFRASKSVVNKFNYTQKADLPLTTINKPIKNITLNNLVIKYQDKIVIDKFNYNFECGKKYAIIGASGSGKSSLVKAICQKIKIDNNMIKIDGIELNNINHQSLNQQIGYTSQEALIFDGSVKDNIIFNNKNLDEKLLLELINKFQLEEIINKQSQGDNGKDLSGGEKQRIALARLLLTKKPILILDEATSAIDKKHRQEIEKYLLTLKNTTILFITHHLDANNKQLFDEIIEIKTMN